MSITKAQIILCYEDIYQTSPPVDHISLIENISKEYLLSEIVGLNYRLKPKTKPFIDTSIATQYIELEYFSPSKEIYSKYENALNNNSDINFYRAVRLIFLFSLPKQTKKLVRQFR